MSDNEIDAALDSVRRQLAHARPHKCDQFCSAADATYIVDACDNLSKIVAILIAERKAARAKRRNET